MSSDSTKSSGEQASANSEATRILAAIDRAPSTSPQKLKLELAADIKGAPSNVQLALFTRQPVRLALDGVVDTAGASGDVNVSVTLSKSLEAEVRYGGGKSWVQIDGKWYDLSSAALSSTTGTTLPVGSLGSVDPNKILTAIGDPSKLLENTSVTSEKVESIDSDKVSGDINIAAAAKALGNLSNTLGSTTTRPASAKQVAELEKGVKEAHVELWVGKADHKVHRAKLALDAELDKSSTASMGIESLKLDLDVTSVDSAAPDVSAPSSVGTQAELESTVLRLFSEVVAG